MKKDPTKPHGKPKGLPKSYTSLPPQLDAAGHWFPAPSGKSGTSKLLKGPKK